MNLKRVGFPLFLILFSTGCVSRYWTEDSAIRGEELTIAAGATLQVDGTIALGGELGNAEVAFCALYLDANYEAVPDQPALEFRQANEELAAIGTANRFRFDDVLTWGTRDPAIEFTRADEECSFSFAFTNTGTEAVELGIALWGRFGGPDNAVERNEIPPNPNVAVNYALTP